MAALSTYLPTLLDQAKRTDPNGAIAKVAEVMQRQNSMLEDAVFIEGNLPTGHTFTSRTGLPAPGWKKMNEGVIATKSKTDQITESCGILGNMSIVDVDIANIGGNAPAFRASEDVAFVQGFNNEFERSIIYESSKTNPERIMGLSPRMDTIAGNPYGGQVVPSQIAAVGADQTSVWIIAWGPDTVHCIYPKGSQAGLEMKDMGEQLVLDANGNRFRAYVTDWKWKFGLCVRDARYLVRLCNIDTSAIAKSGSLLIQSMVDAVERMQDLNTGRVGIYCNRTVMTYLRQQSIDSTKQSTLTFDSVGGKPALQFSGIPIRRSDSILNTEAVIS